MQWVLMGRRVLRRVLRRGSKKGLSRRHLEGRNTPFREYDPLVDTEYDRAKVPLHNGNDPRPPLVV